MMKYVFSFLLVNSLLNAVIAQIKPQTDRATVSKVWVADNGDGTYKNPIIYADYSDPDVIRVGSDYYMTASSFQCMPGLPILHSKDLVNWRIVNYALKKQIPAEVFDVPQHGYGVWAPSLRFHNNEFYIYWGDPDHGVYLIKSKSVMGDWSKPLLVMPGKGIIDPCPLWDDDGKVYLVHGWAASRSGINSLLTVYRMNAEGTQVVDEGKHVFDGHGANHTIEGPKFYKRNGYYYIFAPAGGVVPGWQLALRSKNIYGPYEAKVVLEQGKTAINGPHQGGWIDTPTANGRPGESWFIHFQDTGVYGRVLHLQPVKWLDDWPVMGKDQDGNGIGEPVMTYKKPGVGRTYPMASPQESDEFDTDTLGLQWQWQANPKVMWSALMRGKGSLRLFAYPQPEGATNFWPTPNLLLQKFPAPDFTATTQVKLTVEWDAPGKKAGLLIMGNDYAYVSISKDETGYKLSQVVCKDALNKGSEKVVAEKPLPANTAYLQVHITSPDAQCHFSYSTDGTTFLPIGEPFKAQADKWIGAKVGLFCTSQRGVRHGSYADFDWFRIEKPTVGTSRTN